MLSLLIDLLQDAGRRTRDGMLEPIRLAALVWAACLYLEKTEGIQSKLDEWDEWGDRPGAVRSTPEAAARLADLPAEVEAEALYAELVACLVGIDSDFDPLSPPAGFPSFTVLEELQSGEVNLLRGTVFHWLQAPSVIRERRARARLAPGGAKKYHRFPDCLMNSLAFHKDDDQLPNLDTTVDLSPSLLASRADQLARQGDFRIALCPLDGPWRPQFRIVRGLRRSLRFVARRTQPTTKVEELKTYLDAVLKEAVDQKVRVLVFPELSIDCSVRSFLRKRLRSLGSNPLLAVVAGSFHVWPSEGVLLTGQAVGRDRPCNEAVVWSGTGETLWEHRKRGDFSLSPRKLSKEFFPGVKKIPSRSIGEGIKPGNLLVLANTGLANVAVLICADAIDRSGKGYRELVQKVRPDLVIVIAMTPKTSRFESFLDEMVEQDIGVVLVNSSCVCNLKTQQKPNAALAIFDVSLPEEPKGIPTRWRWLPGFKPEWFSHRDETWRPASDLSRSPPVSLSLNNSLLVLNLGEFVAPWTPRSP